MRPFLTLSAIVVCTRLVLGQTPPATTTDSPPPDEFSTAINTAIVPASKLENDSYDWWQRHKDELTAKDRIHPQIVLIGDSITHFWGGEPQTPNHSTRGPLAWTEAFGTLPVLNLGFGYDRTQNVLWRLDHGEFDGLTPKWVVINIGTNNIHGTSHARANTPQEIVDGIMAIADRVHTKSPESRIIVMAVFPRGQEPTNDFRPKIAAINDLLSQTVKTHPEITYLDIGPQFLLPDGTLPMDMMSDGTHPTDKGYHIWAEALVAAGVRN